MKKLFFLIIVMILCSVALAGKKKTNYVYKKYEKFDFEDLQIEGETGAPSDLSVSNRFQRRFKNKLPYRKNFNAEIKKSVERVR